MSPAAVAVLDIGKTHSRLVVVGDGRRSLLELARANRSREGPPYRHFDAGGLWSWIVDSLRSVATRFDIRAVIPCTHGSALAVIDEEQLVLPVMDYTTEPPAEIVAEYRDLAPGFAETGSLTAPMSLTAACQLLHQARLFPDAFARARFILPYAQYWAWLLSGEAASEVTSLGAQTHLWNPTARRFSSLAEAEGWASRFPPLRPAWERLGPVRREIAAATGLASDCAVLCGIHDSSASYLAYLSGGLTRDTVLSTGTWIIGFDPLQPIERLDPARDTASNSTVDGWPLASSRYMGGQEFTHLLNGASPGAATPASLQAVIASGRLALPSFVAWGGPYRGCRGRIVGSAPSDEAQRAALAALYTALATNRCLDLLGSREGVIIEGPFAKNAIYRRVLAALRPDQPLSIATAPGGSALGASLLYRWKDSADRIPLALEPVPAELIAGLDDYAARWREMAEQVFASTASGALHDPPPRSSPTRGEEV
jgi:sugar (pentulose or hexulose) kinase